MSRSIASFAAKVPNRLVMCTADSNGSRAGWDIGSSMRGTGWDDRDAIRDRSRRRQRVAPDQELCRDRGRDGGWRLVANLGEADRADQAADFVVAEADLTQRARKAGALGGAADQPH